MKVKGLDNKEYTWNITTKIRSNASNYHIRARKLLKELFPCDYISEELSIPGTKTRDNHTLYADFYIDSRKLMIEVQGEQHSKFSSFLHKNDKRNFFKGQMRDSTKKNWCLINNIRYVELPYNETEEQWITRIIGEQ